MTPPLLRPTNPSSGPRYPQVLYAVVGTALSSIFVGLCLYWLSQGQASYAMSLAECLAFGSLISATDPVLYGHVPAHPHTHHIFRRREQAKPRQPTPLAVDVLAPRIHSHPTHCHTRTQVSVLAVFEQLKVDPLMFYLVFGESVLNDAVALVLFNIFSNFVGAEITAGSMAFAALDFLVIFFGACVRAWAAFVMGGRRSACCVECMARMYVHVLADA